MDDERFAKVERLRGLRGGARPYAAGTRDLVAGREPDGSVGDRGGATRPSRSGPMRRGGLGDGPNPQRAEISALIR